VGEYEFPLPEKGAFTTTLIDPWEMIEKPLLFSRKKQQVHLF
jgi:hypothetical protein